MTVSAAGALNGSNSPGKLADRTISLRYLKILLKKPRPIGIICSKKDKELSTKADSLDYMKASISSYEARVEELELQIQKHIVERNELELKLEETLQDSGINDIKEEFHVMASALSKEMQMMEAQLNQAMDAACEALSLHDEANSLKAKLEDKMNSLGVY